MRKSGLVIVISLLFLLLSGCDLINQLPTKVNISLLQGQDTVEINSEWVDAGAKLYVGSTEYIATTTDTVDTSLLGLYEVTYGYEYAGIAYTVTRYVIVVDQTAPEISLVPGIDTVKINTEWIDNGVEVEDNSLETIEVAVTGEVDITSVGLYIVAYSVTDSSGNSSTVERYVNVIE